MLALDIIYHYKKKNKSCKDLLFYFARTTYCMINNEFDNKVNGASHRCAQHAILSAKLEKIETLDYAPYVYILFIDATER